MAERPDREAMRQAAALVREEDLEELEHLSHDLQQRADKAAADGRIYLFSQYIRLIALVSPEVIRIRKRFERESLATFRKVHKQLKKDRKEQESV
ncbi:MAG TPA: hypothetical protein VKV40_08040 [Ktedonobacteraceae bacterium]|nr:hypothetical protein [Ktedonobacteraceae bacterium]